VDTNLIALLMDHASDDGFVFVTGQMPDTPATPGVLPDGIVEQTKP